MGLRRAIHDFFGYRGKQKELHAMLCVIEAHIRSNPEKWVWCEKKVDKRSGYYNDQKGVFINGDTLFLYPAVFIHHQIIGWKKLEITDAWQSRIDRLCDFLRRQSEKRTSLKNKKLKEATKLRQKEDLAKIVERFKPPKASQCQTSTEHPLSYSKGTSDGLHIISTKTTGSGKSTISLKKKYYYGRGPIPSSIK